MAFLDSIVGILSNPLVIISAVLWLLAYVSLKYTKNGKKYLHYMFPFLLLLRTERFNMFFRKLASRGRRVWRGIFNVGIVVAFATMVFALYFFVKNLFSLIFTPKIENAVAPLIPGVTVSFDFFSYLVIPIIIILTVHESCHAIASEIDDIKIKSSGLLAAGVLVFIGFGAFVELNDQRLFAKDIKRSTRMRIITAGVMGNMVTAGVVLLLVLNFSSLMAVGYSTSSFRVTYVLPESEGGFNQNNIMVGDVVLDINGTVPDYENGVSLGSILDNKTAIKIKPGDSLIFNVRNPNSKEPLSRNLVLGHHWFVGFQWSKHNNTAINVTRVYTRLQGGNNQDNIVEGAIITHINGTTINYETNQTLGNYLVQNPPNGQILLGSDNGTDYLINLNYFPTTPCAFVLEDVYIGLNYNKISDSVINITKVLSNSSEGGVNEGNIPEGVMITKINGKTLNLSDVTFAEWVKININPQIGDTLVFTDDKNIDYQVVCKEILLSYVFIGIQSETYWIEKNWWGELFGGLFPEKLKIQMNMLWALSFSIAIFNMLPGSIFDGGHLFRELLDHFIGSEYVKGKSKKQFYEVSSENDTVELGIQRVEDIENVKLLSYTDYNVYKVELGRDKSVERAEEILSQLGGYSNDFEKIDSYNLGYVDSVKFNQKPEGEKYVALVSMVHEEDIKAPKKKLIGRVFSIAIIGLLVANILLSYIFLGNPLMGL